MAVGGVACVQLQGDTAAVPARPHPHDELRAIDPCAVQIGGDMRVFGVGVPVFTVTSLGGRFGFLGRETSGGDPFGLIAP